MQDSFFYCLLYNSTHVPSPSSVLMYNLMNNDHPLTEKVFKNFWPIVCVSVCKFDWPEAKIFIYLEQTGFLSDADVDMTSLSKLRGNSPLCSEFLFYDVGSSSESKAKLKQLENCPFVWALLFDVHEGRQGRSHYIWERIQHTGQREEWSFPRGWGCEGGHFCLAEICTQHCHRS